MKVMPFHQRLGELFITNQTRGMNEDEQREFYICLKANVEWCWEQAYAHNLKYVANMVHDVDWANEISIEYE